MNKARLMSVKQPQAGDWLLAQPITSVGLRMSDEDVRISAGVRLGALLCQPHICVCGTKVDARGIHGLSCRKNAGRQIRHNSINDTVWRAMRRAGIPSIKEPLCLLRDDGKRRDGVTMIPWSRGRCVAWDVTVPDTYAATHLPLTSITPSADRAETNKRMKYQLLTKTHTFTPLAVETTGSFNTEASKFVQDIERRCTEATGDIKETAYLFEQVSVAIQRGNALSIRGTLINPTRQCPIHQGHFNQSNAAVPYPSGAL